MPINPFDTERKTEALVPPDLQGTRQNQIALINWLMGFGPAPGQGGTSGQRVGPGPLMGPQGFVNRARGAAQGGQPNAFIGGQDNARSRFEQFFGPMGVPQSDLQRQSAGGISQFLNQPAPEQRALDIALPGLQEILSGSGGPQFERDIAMANQQGGRFASGNAVLRGEALRHQYNQRDQAANTLGLLSQAAGQNPFSRLMGAGQFGTTLAQQGDVGTQRLLQFIQWIMSQGQGAAFNVPIQQQPSGWDNFLSAAGTVVPFVGGGKK